MTSPASIVDPVSYKAAVRAEWRDAAAGWRAWADVLEAPGAGLAVSRRLVELAGMARYAVLDRRRLRRAGEAPGGRPCGRVCGDSRPRAACL